MLKGFKVCFSLFFLVSFFGFDAVVAQKQKTDKDKAKKQDSQVRTVTIPVSILSKKEIKEKRPEEYLEAGQIIVKENGDEQVILSINSVSENPLSLAVLVQDDLSPAVNNELNELKEFITRLPKGSRVMVGYLRSGSLQVRQKFTDDLKKASNALRILGSSIVTAPGNPFSQVSEALDRFDALPQGRRAILLLSDGADFSAGFQNFTSQSLELEKTIRKAQKRSVAVYSIFALGSSTNTASSSTILSAQSSLDKLSDETGGKAFFQGTSTPVSFFLFFRDVSLSLSRQFALTYLSTHMKKGYYKVQVISTNPEIKIEHPKGYFYRKR